MINVADRTNIRKKYSGFSLIEILISILVVGGILTIMYSGFSTSKDLILQASFESEAAFLAEREIEFIKSELSGGLLKPIETMLKGRFKVKPEWVISSFIAPDKISGIFRILTRIENHGKKFALESFIYLPDSEGAINEG